MRMKPLHNNKSPQWTRNGLTQATHFEVEPMRIRSRIVAREFKSADRPGLHAATPSLEALRTVISIAANHKDTFSIMHIDVSRAYFHAKAQRLVLVRLRVEDRIGADAREIGLMKKRTFMVQGTQPAIGSVTGMSTSKAGAFSLGSARRICFTMERIEFQE